MKKSSLTVIIAFAAIILAASFSISYAYTGNDYTASAYADFIGSDYDFLMEMLENYKTTDEVEKNLSDFCQAMMIYNYPSEAKRLEIREQNRNCLGIIRFNIIICKIIKAFGGSKEGYDAFCKQYKGACAVIDVVEGKMQHIMHNIGMASCGPLSDMQKSELFDMRDTPIYERIFTENYYK